jgi:hypothetical protein
MTLDREEMKNGGDIDSSINGAYPNEEPEAKRWADEEVGTRRDDC